MYVSIINYTHEESTRRPSECTNGDLTRANNTPKRDQPKTMKNLKGGRRDEINFIFFLTMIEPRHTRDGSEGKQKHSSSWENGVEEFLDSFNNIEMINGSSWRTRKQLDRAESNISTTLGIFWHCVMPRTFLELITENLCFYLILLPCLRRALAERIELHPTGLHNILCVHTKDSDHNFFPFTFSLIAAWHYRLFCAAQFSLRLPLIHVIRDIRSRLRKICTEKLHVERMKSCNIFHFPMNWSGEIGVWSREMRAQRNLIS